MLWSMWGRVVPSNFYPSHCGLPRLCSLEVGSRSLLPTESMSIILRGWDFIPNDWDRRILIKLFSSKYLWFSCLIKFPPSTHRISDSKDQNDNPQKSLANMNLSSEYPFHPTA